MEGGVSLYITALALGLGMGWHCVGMCGPIVLSMGLSTKNRYKLVVQSLLYHLGRITTYTLLGGIMGMFGRMISTVVPQKYLLIVIGALLILYVILAYLLKVNTTIFNIDKYLVKIKILLAKFLKQDKNSSRYFVGLLNGLVPCGLVYGALTTSIATGNVVSGMIYMACFGLGTIPFLFALMLVVGTISLKWRNLISKLYPIFLFLLGVFLIHQGITSRTGSSMHHGKSKHDMSMPNCH